MDIPDFKNMVLGDFIFNPIIPVKMMIVICVVLLVFKRKGVIPYIRQILTVLLLFLINLRPMYPDDNIRVEKQKIDMNIVFVVDDTISMLAEDQEGYETRMDAAKADMYYIIDSLPGARFSVLAFNNEAQVLSPFTDSEAYVKNAIDMIAPIPSLYATGTNISVCYEALDSVLTSVSISNNSDDDDEDEADSSPDTDRTMVFFFTDGENTDNNTLSSFSRLSDRVDGGAVIGYGTERGGQMHYMSTQFGTVATVIDQRGNGYSAAVSKIDVTNLNQIANDLNIQYIHNTDRTALDNTIDEIKAIADGEADELFKQGYSDVYFWFVIPLVPLVAYEFISLKRRG